MLIFDRDVLNHVLERKLCLATATAGDVAKLAFSDKHDVTPRVVDDSLESYIWPTLVRGDSSKTGGSNAGLDRGVFLEFFNVWKLTATAPHGINALSSAS